MTPTPRLSEDELSAARALMEPLWGKRQVMHDAYAESIEHVALGLRQFAAERVRELKDCCGQDCSQCLACADANDVAMRLELTKLAAARELLGRAEETLERRGRQLAPDHYCFARIARCCVVGERRARCIEETKLLTALRAAREGV